MLQKIFANKNLLITLLVAGALLYVFLRSRDFFDSKSAENKRKRQQPETTDFKTYTDSFYKSMANKIYDAMKGWGTDYDQIEDEIIQLKTNRDAELLDNAFSIRDKMSLGAWLNSEGVLDEVHDQLERMNLEYTFPIADERSLFDKVGSWF